MSLKALGLPPGLVLRHGGRAIRILGDDRGVALRIEDVATGEELTVPCAVTGREIRPTIEWIFAERDAGRLEDPEGGSTMDGRRRSFMGLDRAACIRRDPKSARRFRWAWAAWKDGPPTTSDDSFETWIKEHPELVNDEEGRPEPVPPASTLRGWVRVLEATGGRRGGLVSGSGRLKGQSPLPALEDRLLKETAAYYWSSPGQSVVGAGSYYLAVRDLLAADPSTSGKLAAEPVRLETIRFRVRRREGRDATAARDGEREARRMFEPAGDLVLAERFLERVYMDGCELRQHVVYADDWPVPAGRMKLVNAVDGSTLLWWPPAMACGPYREELSLEALRNVMAPSPDISPEHLARFPALAAACGCADLIKPDNDKTLVGPAYIAAIGELGTTVELPRTFDPDGKSPVELVNRFVKRFMDAKPGTVTRPGRRRDPARNAVAEGEMTRLQCRFHVMEAWLIWNTAPRDFFGGRSPLEMAVESMRERRPLRHSPAAVRRALSKTHEGGVLTRDGFEFDGAVYKGEGFAKVLADNYHRTGFRDRVDGTAKVRVSFRTFEPDLDAIEIYDEENGTFVEGRSTDPHYFAGLGRWEHSQHKLFEASRRPRKDRERERMRLGGDSVRRALADLPAASTRTAGHMAALIEAAEKRVRAADGEPSPPPELLGAPLFARTGSDMRQDPPKPVRVPAGARAPARPEAPQSVVRRVDPAPRDDPQDEPTDADEGEDRFVWPELPDDDDTEEHSE